jgi:hypothetical protein
MEKLVLGWYILVAAGSVLAWTLLIPLRWRADLWPAGAPANRR